MESGHIEPYCLLDAGEEKKVELLGSYRVIRQAAQAHWPKTIAEQWKGADATHQRSKRGGGHWDFHTKLPAAWPVSWGGLNFLVKLTDFGHIGLFPEQNENWQWIDRQCQGEPIHVLNLFGYTGGSSMAAAKGGAQVTHVDASKGVVGWGRENQKLNGLDDAPIRWIIDDCTKYLQREIRRGSTYQGLILDPPSFGRGPNGQAWKIEDALLDLLLLAKELLNPLRFILLSCHTPGYTGLCLANILNSVFKLPFSQMDQGEMVVPLHQSERVLPSGNYARWPK